MPPSAPIKIAIVGTGLIGPRHAEAVLKEPDAELACIVDPSPAAESIAQTFKCPIYKSVREMLSSPHKPDAALVCTPNHTHVPISKELLEGGVHVLCEKPISVDVLSGRELIDCAKQHSRHLLTGHHRRFNQYVVKAKQLLPSLGQIVAVNGLWTLYKPTAYFDPPTEWRRLESAGPVLINLIHDIDVLHYLFGPIVRVYAEKSASQRGFKAEEGAAITLRFANGIVGTFLLSDAVVSPHSFESGTGENPMIPRTGQDFYRIFGSDGSLSVPDMTRCTYAGGEKRWTETLNSEKFDVQEMRTPFELQIENFIKVIRGSEVPSCTGTDGLRAVLVCAAIKQSLMEERRIDVLVE